LNKLTERGVRVILSITILAIFSYLLNDVILLGGSVVLLGFLLFQYVEITRATREIMELVISPREVSLRVIAGDEVSEVVQTSSSSLLDWSIDFGLEYLSAEPSVIGFGDVVFVLVYRPVLGGVKQVKHIMLEATDKYRLFESKASHDVDYTLTSYPRVFAVAAQALSYLSEMGLGRQGEQPTNLRGEGIDFAESRLYQPGDPLNRFDWKAYAKTTNPMVKTYYIEGGGGTSIVYDNVADNPVSRDDLNHAFLSLVLTLTQQEEPTQINLLEQRETYQLDRHNTLLIAVQIALEGQTKQFIEYYGLIEPRIRRVNLFRRLLTQKHQSTRANEYSTNIIVTSLTGNPRHIHEIIENIASQEISLLVPTKPWLWQTSLQKTSQVYKSCLRQVETYNESGVEVYYSLEKLLNKVERHSRVHYTF
jgi:hypothetical protein